VGDTGLSGTAIEVTEAIVKSAPRSDLQVGKQFEKYCPAMQFEMPSASPFNILDSCGHESLQICDPNHRKRSPKLALIEKGFGNLHELQGMNTAGEMVVSPKGGGAPKGIDGRFSNLRMKATHFAVRIAVSPDRNGIKPQLDVPYAPWKAPNPLGFGWSEPVSLLTFPPYEQTKVSARRVQRVRLQHAITKHIGRLLFDKPLARG
jgi:hypothetical protein